MSLDEIKRLRELTSVGINDCKKALSESAGDFNKALGLLRKRGIQIMEKKSGRTASQGLVDAYIHFGGNLGVLVEVNCETDFVARTEVFKKFVKDVAMQVAACQPKYIKREDVPEQELEGVKSRDDFFKENCLLDQSFVRDAKLTMLDYLRDVISQTGENVSVRRFVRFSLGVDNEG